MAFGIQVTLDDGRDLIALLTPVFYLDFITTASGSKTYSVPSGFGLRYSLGTGRYQSTSAPAANVSVSGNTVTWSNASVTNNILIYAGR